MAIFINIDSGTAPSKVTSGVVFGISLNFHTLNYGIYLLGVVYKIDFTLWMNGIAIETWSQAGTRSQLIGEYGERIYHSHSFGVPQIETALNRVPNIDETTAVSCILTGVLYSSGAPYTAALEQSSPLTWTVHIIAANVVIWPEEWSFPATVKRDELFDAFVSVAFLMTIKYANYCKNYIEAEYMGQRCLLRLVEEWSNSAQQLPFKRGLGISNINIESIVGQVVENRFYDIDIICGTLAAGTIYGTGTGWQRVDEARATWHVYVTVAPPAPNFLPPPDSVYPPYFVNIDQTFEVILAIENYGSPGDIYLDINGREVWRRWITYLGTDTWRSGDITVEELAGYEITEEGEIEVIFECGYIDESGAKVATSFLPRSIYVTVPSPPPKANLSGVVSDELGNPIEEAEVIINAESVLTNSGGVYGFTNLDVAYYNIRCSKEGYATYSSGISLFEGDNTLNVILEVKRALPSLIPVVGGVAVAVVVAILIGRKYA